MYLFFVSSVWAREKLMYWRRSCCVVMEKCVLMKGAVCQMDKGVWKLEERCQRRGYDFSMIMCFVSVPFCFPFLFWKLVFSMNMCFVLVPF